MTSQMVWILAAAPLGLLLCGLRNGSTAGVNRLAVATALAAVLIAIGGAAAVIGLGVLQTPSLAWNGVGFGIYLDSLSATLFCLVAFIGLIVLRFSATYMDGDPRQALFTRLLCVTLASVLTLAISGNLFQFVLAWVATSLGLHQLLVFYRDRPAAIIAGRKKFIASRIGDACLVVAMLLLLRSAGSLDYQALFDAAQGWRQSGLHPSPVGAAAMLMVIAGLLKSAQFPTHGWLMEVMETPTPVSALLHAGIINAGGFLVLRFSPLIALSLPSLDVLALVGGLTALFGSVILLTQTSVKVSLACSTIAQMGFMMLECGLGAFAAALLHIVAHSLYKAHAFLSSGSVIDIARASWTPSPGGRPHPWRLVFAIGGVLAITLLFSAMTGATLTREPGVFALGAVLVLGLIHLMASGIDQRPNAFVLVRVLLLACVTAAAYFSLQYAADRLFAGSLPHTAAMRGPFGLAVVVLVVLSFSLVTFVQAMISSRPQAPRWQALYAHVANGFYVNTLVNRMVLWLWGGSLPAEAAPVPPLKLGAHR